MSRAKLILVPSVKMDSNKKEDRNEHGLVRMSKAVRDVLEFDKSVEIYPETKNADERLGGSMLLDIFQAFSEDLRKARESGLSEEEMKRVGFVTTKTFQKITGNQEPKISKNIWISDDVSDTVIGADPEFLLFDTDNNIIRANNVLGYHGPLGCDGAMAEVRPKPAISPESLTENIRILLADTQYTDNIKAYKWVAGCYFKDNNRDYPIGGHIHIGNPVKIARINIERRSDFFKAFNKILDELLSIPMIKIDGADLGGARRTGCTMGKYGYFGELRTDKGRLEHRTLSGMWLMHPVLSTLVLGTAKAIIDEVYRHVADNKFDLEYMFPSGLRGAHIWSADFSRWQDIPLVKDIGCVLPSTDMIELLHKSAAAKITTKFLNTWHSRMKSLSTYKMYSKYIDGLREVLKNSTKAFHDYDKGLQKNWLEGAKFLN
jgi:hypothetical protein